MRRCLPFALALLLSLGCTRIVDTDGYLFHKVKKGDTSGGADAGTDADGGAEDDSAAE